MWCVQHLLNQLTWGTGYHQIAEDGAFGPDTNGAILAFQRWDQIPADGIVGPQTGGDLLTATYGGQGTDCYSYLPSK